MTSGRSLFGGKARPNDKEGSSGNQAIRECVEKGLLDTLGGSAEAATLYFIETKGGVKLSKVSRDPEGFLEALRAIFGQGSVELMKAILKELRLKEAKLGRDRLVHDFADFLERAIKPAGAGTT
ncbi:MAG TPA: hypothetical protein VLU99_06300 [Nitrososphaerales archaeon]|nr:hypothetical protein [Nitrososphaerales archaeon]